MKDIFIDRDGDLTAVTGWLIVISLISLVIVVWGVWLNRPPREYSGYSICRMIGDDTLYWTANQSYAANGGEHYVWVAKNTMTRRLPMDQTQNVLCRALRTGEELPAYD
jgi:hypothetical protein